MDIKRLTERIWNWRRRPARSVYAGFTGSLEDWWASDVCPMCGGDGFVRCQEYYNDTQNYSPDEFELCPDCAGDGVIGS